MAREDLQEIIDANRDYLADNSVTKAHLYISALEGLLIEPTSLSSKGENLGYDAGSIRYAIDRATAFINSADQSSSATSRVRTLGVSEAFRG